MPQVPRLGGYRTSVTLVGSSNRATRAREVTGKMEWIKNEKNLVLRFIVSVF